MNRNITRNARRGFGLALVAAFLLGSLPGAHAVPIDPGSLSGITGWYKADGLSGYSEGDAVTLWSDSGPNAYHMAQDNVLIQPTYVADAANGIPGVHFARGQYLNAGDVEYQELGLFGMTVIGVGLPEGNGAFAAKMDFRTEGRQWRLTSQGFDVQAEPSSWDATNLAPIPSASQDYNWQVVGGTWTSGTTKGFLNGEFVDQAENPAYIMPDTTTEVLMGAANAGTGNLFAGYISELLFFNRALSDTEMAGVSEYLAEKYAITPGVPSDPSEKRVNFQPSGFSTPAGYMADTGAVYGPRGSEQYGWTQSATGQALAATSGQVPAERTVDDPRYDSLIYMRNDDFKADWEIALPNGYYWVRGVFGDPRVGQGTGIQNMVIEGHDVTDPTPVYGTTDTGDWDEHWGIVEVTDGRLTVGVGEVLIGDDPVTGEPVFAPASGKINTFEIRQRVVPEFAITFAPTSYYYANPGYLRDIGSAYGLQEDGYTYGWLDADDNPLDNTGAAAASGAINQPGLPPGDGRFITHIGLGANKWELEIENGTYNVVAVFGDGGAINDVTIEGVPFVDVDPQKGTSDQDVFMGNVNITDGRLTIQGADGNTLARIMYLELVSTAAGPVTLPGDLNGDGVVNSGDLDLVRGHWGTTDPAGDANGDGIVNSGDLDIVRANWGATLAAAVPEPGAITLLLLAGLAAVSRRRRA